MQMNSTVKKERKNSKVKAWKEEKGQPESNLYKLTNKNVCKEDISKAKRNWHRLVNTNLRKEGTSISENIWGELADAKSGKEDTNKDERNFNNLGHYVRNTNEDVDSIITASSAMEAITSVSSSECATETDNDFKRRDVKTKHHIENVTNGLESLWKEIGGLRSAQICHRSEYNSLQKRLASVEKEVVLQKDEFKESVDRIEKLIESKCASCTSTANELEIVKTELASQKEEVFNSIRKLEKRSGSKCDMCTSTGKELTAIKSEISTQKNKFLNSMKKLKERNDNNKYSTALKEIDVVKTELAAQKDVIGKLVKRADEMYNNKYTSCMTPVPTKDAENSQQCSTTSPGERTLSKNDSTKLADDVEQKLSELIEYVKVDSADADAEETEHVQNTNEDIWENYRRRCRKFKSSNAPFSKYLREYDLKTGEKLIQIRDEICDIAGNLELYAARNEEKLKILNDIPCDKN